ncbi:MAG TPA: hypothetical protein VI685_29260 [Candidatus Angelobacter sp.]
MKTIQVRVFWRWSIGGGLLTKRSLYSCLQIQRRETNEVKEVSFEQIADAIQIICHRRNILGGGTLLWRSGRREICLSE